MTGIKHAWNKVRMCVKRLVCIAEGKHAWQEVTMHRQSCVATCTQE